MKKWAGVGLTLLLFGACLTLRAQTGTEGSILGSVVDASGAAVPEATVTVTNTETGISTTVKSNASGFFQVLALPRGFYTVTVSHTGFAQWQLVRTELTVGMQKRISPVLKVGTTRQEVTVKAGAELIRTEQASLEDVVEQKQIVDLPLVSRDPIQMVGLVPGMRYLGVSGNSLDHTVQGLGQHTDATQFTVDGVSANDPSSETGMAFPNLDTVAQFRVQTSNFSAEFGRQAMQVAMVTKSGTNDFHGDLWEFLRNDALDARNAFSDTVPKLARNQYGFTLGGPIIKNRTFFFTSFEGLRVRQQGIYNSPTINPAFLTGDFSSVSKQLVNPFTGTPFVGNQIPTTMFSSASKYFFPYLLLPNASGDLFKALAPQPENGTNFLLRLDHQINPNQKLYVRWIRIGDWTESTGYQPSVRSTQDVIQHNIGLHYDWSITPTTLFTVTAGFVHSHTIINSPNVGVQNDDELAGIQGFPTAGREGAIGIPTVTITGGYTGFGYPTQVPASFKREILDGTASVNMVRGQHTIGFGTEWLDNRTDVHHASSYPRGQFNFNGQYTGNGFADFLLGLTQQGQRNYPIAAFGMAHSPYSGLYITDTWRATSRITLDLGLRWDHWYARANVRGGAATFDLAKGVAVAAENKDGKVDLTAQPTAPFLAAFMAGYWVPASENGYPPGLYEPKSYLSPRLGMAWRPTGSDDLVVRGAFGIFTDNFNGNVTGSAIIGPPYWAFERVSFSKASNQDWATAFPSDPTKFVAPSISAADVAVKPMKIHQWNVSVQKALPRLASALTVSYVGNRGYDLIAHSNSNEVPPGQYANLQAAKPYPLFGTIRLYQNFGAEWFNALQVRMERRFHQGFSYTVAYQYSRNIDLYGDSQTKLPTVGAPPNYDRGTSVLERRHILTVNSIYDLPVGRGLRFGSNMPKVANWILGGWEVSGIYSFIAGTPLTFAVPGATLGNGFNARPNIVGNLGSGTCPNGASVGTVNCWYNDTALAAPPKYTFGDSGVGIYTGPGTHTLDTALMKNFHFGETRYVQFRWEMFNALNHVNLNDPNTTINQATTGKILSAGDPRIMQFGLKVYF